MIAYKKERIENAILFFAKEHRKKTKQYISQTALYKYLAFFEFRLLKKQGEMPLELTYQAMEHGPVPIEIYKNHEYCSLIKMEPFLIKNNQKAYKIIPNGKFNSDYFSENEIKEMNNLIDMFAQKEVGAAIMSAASHQAIKAWFKTYHNKPNSIIDPINEFDRNILTVPVNELKSEEEKYLMFRKLSEIVN